MKKCKTISVIFLAIISAFFIACFCTGCDFVQYIEKIDNQVVSDEVKQLQEDYVNKLHNVTSEIKYRENERRIFEYALQDAVNELHECYSEEELKEVYDKHLVIIGKIKTDKEYSDEEEANAISAYRVAILGQAEESYDKQKYSEEQIIYFDSLLATFSGELFETNDREVMNELLQKFYFDVLKEDEILSLINYAEISNYEDSQKKILTVTLNQCIEDIRSYNSREEIDEVKEVYKFEVYKRDTVKKLNQYVDLRLYRDEQATEIKAILTEHLKLAEQAIDKIEADNSFREYQIAVYDIPTDEMLYAEELDELKTELSTSLTDTYKFSYYRESEGQEVDELIKTFQTLLDGIKKKEDVLSQYILVKSRLDSVKTAKILDEEDRLNLIEELYFDLQNRIEKNIDGPDKDEFLLKAENTYLDMQDRLSLDGVCAVHRVLANEISAKFGAVMDILKEELSGYKNAIYYREKEQDEINLLKEGYLIKLAEDIGIDDAKALLQEAKNAIDEIKTNDDLWNDSLIEFRADLKLLYGDSILEEPRSLTEANDYYELADIIDYYAFYQLSSTEFVCNNFRVKINFAHNDAWTELVNVYWYCELIRTAVGITNYFENNSDYLVIQLIPYDFASVSNERPTLNRFDSAVEFNSDKSKMTARSDDFDDFAYYKYERTINVWNSQQLWYALEHEYVPICAPDSPAERVMNRAKEILREIIMEGMSDEEKIFQIYTWFGENIEFDNDYNKYYNLSDLIKFPDKNISTLLSFHAEGAILEQLSVCYGCAKANLIFLRLEGIETYYVTASFNIASLEYTGDGEVGHGYNYIKLNDNWFIGDPERSFGLDNSGIIYGSILLPAYENYPRYSGRLSRVNSRLWPLIDAQAKLSLNIYENLVVKDINIMFIQKETLDLLINTSIIDSVKSFCVFTSYDTYDDVQRLILENGNWNYRRLDYHNMVEIFCYII